MAKEIYNPNDSITAAKKRIQKLREQISATIPDEELFEVLADVHAAIANQLISRGIEGILGSIIDRKDVCINIPTEKGVLGFGYKHRYAQKLFLEIPGLDCTFFFNNNYGIIELSRSSFEEEDGLDEHFASLNAFERRLLVDNLYNSLNRPISEVSC